jgi:hypothetical protein
MKRLINTSIFCSGMLFMLNCFGAPAAPTVSTSTDGLTVTVNWTASLNADGYILFYAPIPYTMIRHFRQVMLF